MFEVSIKFQHLNLSLREPKAIINNPKLCIPVVEEEGSVQGRHVLGEGEQLVLAKLVKLGVEEVDVVSELYVRVCHQELLKREHQVVKRGDVEHVLNNKLS